jgi:hypothetical protein
MKVVPGEEEDFASQERAKYIFSIFYLLSCQLWKKLFT